MSHLLLTNLKAESFIRFILIKSPPYTQDIRQEPEPSNEDGRYRDEEREVGVAKETGEIFHRD